MFHENVAVTTGRTVRTLIGMQSFPCRHPLYYGPSTQPGPVARDILQPHLKLTEVRRAHPQHRDFEPRVHRRSGAINNRFSPFGFATGYSSPMLFLYEGSQ